MKRNSLLLIVLLTCINMMAQSPKQFSYQAVVRNVNGSLTADSPIGIQISILQGSADGTVVYTESQNPRTNANGLISISIGSGDISLGDIANIDWSNVPYFIKTEIDPAGGTDYIIIGTSQLLSVPYALYAEEAPLSSEANTKLLNSEEHINNSEIHFTNATTKEEAERNASAIQSGLLSSEDWIKFNEAKDIASVLSKGNDANGNSIKNIAPPIDNNDAATKAYSDSLIDNYKNHLTSTPDASLGTETYKTIRIGDQIWMAENLRTDRVWTGSELITITQITDANEWATTTEPAFCYYDNDPANEAIYGKIYNGFAINSGLTCPTGFRNASHDDWSKLAYYVNYKANAVLSDADGQWDNSSFNITNETGFSIPHGGSRSHTGVFSKLPNGSIFLSSTNMGGVLLTLNFLENDDIFDYSATYDNHDGGYVRCVKSDPIQEITISDTEGDMLYFEGQNWVSIAKPTDDQKEYTLSWDFVNNKPYWKEVITVK